MTRKVFIPNKGGHDYSRAAEFGEIVFVTEGTQNRFAVANLYRAFIDAMVDSDKMDYFVPSSMNILNAIGAAVFARKHGRLNFLLFREGEYIEREVDIDSLIDVEVRS